MSSIFFKACLILNGCSVSVFIANEGCLQCSCLVCLRAQPGRGVSHHQATGGLRRSQFLEPHIAQRSLVLSLEARQSPGWPEGSPCYRETRSQRSPRRQQSPGQRCQQFCQGMTAPQLEHTTRRDTTAVMLCHFQCFNSGYSGRVSATPGSECTIGVRRNHKTPLC